MAEIGDVIVGLDIGTTKIAVVVGEVTADGIDIIGVGTSASEGLRQGVVVNIEATTNSITAAIREAEQMSAVEIQAVWVGIAGGHIRGFNSHGQVSISNRDGRDGREREVTPEDVARVLEQAQAVNIPSDREIIHTLPVEYMIDGQGQIGDPIGMSGVRMEVRAHIITASATSVQNIRRCCDRAGLEVVGVVLQPLASATTVLHADERDLGVVLIDLGGGTTDLAIYSEGVNVMSSTIVMGGERVTQDLAHGLRTSVGEAEQIKRQHGCALVSLVEQDGMIEVPGVGPRAPRKIAKRFVAEVIEPRIEEILLMAQQELAANGYLELAGSGIVLTGGTALLPGICEIVEDIFQMPVRLGTPVHGDNAGCRGTSLTEGGFAQVIRDPKFSTGVGLVLWGARHEPAYDVTDTVQRRERRSPLTRRFIERVRGLF